MNLFVFDVLFKGLLIYFLVFSGCLYGGWYVRVEGKKGARHAGRFRDGCRESHAERLRKEHVDQEVVEISLYIFF